MTQSVDQSSNKVRMTFGKPIEHDGEEEFVFGSKNEPVIYSVDKPVTSYNEKIAEAGRQRDALVRLGYGPGALIARRHARAQVKNPWTWGVVIFVTNALHLNEVRPIGAVWLSDGPNRGVQHVLTEDVFLVAPPPTQQELSVLLGAV